MSEITYVDPAAMIEQAADPGEFVVQCLERGKTWLAEALEHNDLEALVNMKGYAETLRVATMQKELGRDAQLSATELVRRAERCIVQGIRRGQHDGALSRPGATGPQPDYTRVRNGREEVIQGVVRGTNCTLPSAADATGIPYPSLNSLYPLADDVTDEEFDAAIEEAKAEENLSRANLTRKLKPERAKPKPKDRDDYHHRTRRINPERIIEETINTLEGLAMGLALIEQADYEALDAEKRLEWLEAVRQPLSAITRMKKGLSA